MSDQPGNSLTQAVIEILLGGIGGAITTLVALRTRLASMQRDTKEGDAALARDIADGKADLVRHVEAEQLAFDRLEADLGKRIDAIDDRIGALDKRQMKMLQLLADVARKLNVDNRSIDDALVRMLTDNS